MERPILYDPPEEATLTTATPGFHRHVPPELFDDHPWDTVAIAYLSHSTVLVRIRQVLLLFDFATPGPHPEGSFLGLFPSELVDPYEVFVLASHSHGDHWTPSLLDLPRRDKTHFFLGDDITPPPSDHDVVICPPGQWQERAGARVFACRSSDQGVAFLVEIEGLCLYHSGDNAFWDWDDGRSAEDYFLPFLKPLMDTGKRIHVAFQVADPRQHESHYGGIHDLSSFLDVELLVPIHNFGDFSHHERMSERVATRHPKQEYWDIRENGSLLLRRFPR